MKKTFFYYLFAVLCTVTFMTSCSDDDDPSYPIDEEIAGTYKGALDITLEGTPIASGLPKNITITKASNSTVNMELKDFAFMGMNLGTITLKDCAVSQEGTSYSFTSEQTLTLSSEIGSCLIKVNGTITGTKATINLDIEVTKLDQKVKVVYTGTRLSGSESAEAKITSFIFDMSNKANSIVTQQPIISSANEITFKVSENATVAELKALIPTIVISDKAEVIPASGVVADFSNNKSVTYTVVAENGTTSTYIAKIEGITSSLKYSFEEWKTVGEGKAKHEEPLPDNQLASSVQGASLLFLFGVEGFPVYKSDDVVEGEHSIKLITMDTSAQASSLVPAITAGSVFTGKFNMLPAFTDKLKCTEFGIAYDKKPLYFKGWYKYAPGEKFIDGSDVDNIITVEKTDECALQAVLYEAKDAAGKEVILTGHDINSSAYRVAVAVLKDGSAKADYTKFEIPFTYLEGKSYDQNKTYKMAIVCSSSKEGDFFKGAGGSTLLLDEMEVVGE